MRLNKDFAFYSAPPRLPATCVMSWKPRSAAENGIINPMSA
jgi:hypothetical protein